MKKNVAFYSVSPYLPRKIVLRKNSGDNTDSFIVRFRFIKIT